MGVVAGDTTWALDNTAHAGLRGGGTGDAHRRSVISGLAASAITQRALATPALRPTPQEIVGPFYPKHPLPDHDFDLTHIRGHSGRAKGEIIEVIGHVLRPDGTPIRNAAIEVWQANAAGKYRHPDDTNSAPLDTDFQGYGRFSSASDGGFRLLTFRPGAYSAPVGLRTPHIHFDVQSADCRFVTQMYFPGEPLNVTDAFLSTMTARHLDPTLLIAHEETGLTGAKRYRWEVVLRS